MAAPRSFTAKELESVRTYYVSVLGNKSKVARKFRTTRETIRVLAVEHNWDSDIPKIEQQTREITNRSIAEHRAITIALIDEYVDHQKTLAKSGKDFDASGVVSLVKTRELLTGNATDRLEFDLTRFLAEWSKLDPEERRQRLAEARSKRSPA